MSYQNSYPSAPDYTIGADIAESPQEPLGTRLKTWLFSPRSGPAIERTMHQLEADRCPAFLTASPLRHTVGLSAMEQRAIDNGLLAEAEEKARTTVQAFLSLMPGMDAYTLRIQ